MADVPKEPPRGSKLLCIPGFTLPAFVTAYLSWLGQMPRMIWFANRTLYVRHLGDDEIFETPIEAYVRGTLFFNEWMVGSNINAHWLFYGANFLGISDPTYWYAIRSDMFLSMLNSLMAQYRVFKKFSDGNFIFFWRRKDNLSLQWWFRLSGRICFFFELMAMFSNPILFMALAMMYMWGWRYVSGIGEFLWCLFSVFCCCCAPKGAAAKLRWQVIRETVYVALVLVPTGLAISYIDTTFTRKGDFAETNVDEFCFTVSFNFEFGVDVLLFLNLCISYLYWFGDLLGDTALLKPIAEKYFEPKFGTAAFAKAKELKANLHANALAEQADQLLALGDEEAAIKLIAEGQATLAEAAAAHKETVAKAVQEGLATAEEIAADAAAAAKDGAPDAAAALGKLAEKLSEEAKAKLPGLVDEAAKEAAAAAAAAPGAAANAGEAILNEAAKLPDVAGDAIDGGLAEATETADNIKAATPNMRRGNRRPGSRSPGKRGGSRSPGRMGRRSRSRDRD